MLRGMRKRPPFWPWEKFGMSLYPKIFLVECSISVPNLMLVSSIAQFYQKFAQSAGLLKESRQKKTNALSTT